EDDPAKIHDNVCEDRPMAVKPMNCPGHLLIYKTRLRSYNEFPLRIAEMGLVHRRELSGVRHGLFRVQAFTQDDAHHFCTPDQIGGEIRMLIDFFQELYLAFDLHDVRIEFSTRPEKSIGSDAMWQQAERALKQALESEKIDYELNEGEGAFYGPKIDFHIRDALKRSWQCGTIQLDFSMPERFGLSYAGADGQRHTPVMIHRACYGSVERFLGILVEHYAGAFPFWLAPCQVRILPISEKFNAYAREVNAALSEHGVRSDVNAKDERVGYKIREASLQKIPYVLVVGEKEVSAKTVNVRSRDGGELGAMGLDAFIASLARPRGAPCAPGLATEPAPALETVS
ncbi:MAG: threonine--tRNA ligase, partial [Proteobacteria bacterium]|nr:threonine--tRNA ligase [Pseudomonadota bacterium]